jgi:hypothetical protein
VTTSDDRPAGARHPSVDFRTRVARLAVAIPLAVAGVPLLIVYAYLLFWWAPALAGPGADPCDPGVSGSCWRPEQRTLWIAAAALFLPAAVTLAISWTWLGRVRRWWPWPLAAAMLNLACARVLQQLS